MKRDERWYSYNKRLDYSGRVHDYYLDDVQGEPDGIKMGVELELSNKGSRVVHNAISPIDIPSWWSAKKDSTAGYEFVSLPFYMDFLKKDKEIKSFLTKARFEGLKFSYPKETNEAVTGLHIHVEKIGLPIFDIVCNHVFLHELSYAISKRVHSECNYYSNYNNKEFLFSPNMIEHIKLVISRRRSFMTSDIRRPYSLNLSPCSTIEFRYFAGMASLKHLIRSVEYIHAQISAAKENVVLKNDDSDNVSMFINYVDTHVDKYPTVHQFIHKEWRKK